MVIDSSSVNESAEEVQEELDKGKLESKTVSITQLIAD